MTRKITQAVARIRACLQEHVTLGTQEVWSCKALARHHVLEGFAGACM